MAKTLSTHAAAAKAIRAELSAAFPTVTFKVRARSASMMTAVDVDWTDGPTRDEVQAITGKYQYGHFDGMDDSYHYSNTHSQLPQVKYVQEDRTMSDDAQRAIVAYLNRVWGYTLRLVERTYGDTRWIEVDPASDARRSNNYGWQSHDIGLVYQDMSLMCTDCGAATLPYDAFCPQCGHALTVDEAAA